MSELILHHYAGSPFSEKVRLVLGMKQLDWQSVVVPVMLPKPDVVALTGGYRRTPFLQIGADIYCDSALMCRVIDRLAPQPSLYPAATAGVAETVAQWADSALFWAAVPYTLQPAGVPYIFPGLPSEHLKAFREDRSAMTAGMRRPTPADLAVQLRTYLGRLDNQLGDGRRFLFGSHPCIADFAVAQSIWFIRRAPPVATVLAPYARLLPWFERVTAFGHGHSSELSSEAALDIAVQARSHAPVEVAVGGPFEPDSIVTVTATDYAADPVTGRLVGLDDVAVTIAREDPRAGRLQVHFPRIGYKVQRAE